MPRGKCSAAGCDKAKQSKITDVEGMLYRTVACMISVGAVRFLLPWQTCSAAGCDKPCQYGCRDDENKLYCSCACMTGAGAVRVLRLSQLCSAAGCDKPCRSACQDGENKNYCSVACIESVGAVRADAHVSYAPLSVPKLPPPRFTTCSASQFYWMRQLRCTLERRVRPSSRISL
jgi:hypothetical protein